MAVTGIHGLIAYAVSRRTREIGIRVAVGARSSQVLRLVLTRLIALVLFGLAAGVVLAVAAGQALSSVVYGISPRDPGLLLIVLASLLIAAVLSCWKPLFGALRTDPMAALRYE